MNRYDLLEATNAVEPSQLEETLRFFDDGKERKPVRKTRNAIHVLLIAAALTVLLSATAYAAGLFSMRGEDVSPEESFPVSFVWGDGEELVGSWPATFALRFEGPAECPAVHYRFGWLPESARLGKHIFSQLDEEGWVIRTGGDDGPMIAPWNAHTEFGTGERNLYFTTDMYYSAQFVPDGALILMSAPVLDVSEEQWENDRMVCKIVSSAQFLELDEDGAPLRDEQGDFVSGEIPCNYLVMFDCTQGWIFAVRGTFPMEDLVKIAENIVVEPTGETVRGEDFENPFDFFDAARG